MCGGEEKILSGQRAQVTDDLCHENRRGIIVEWKETNREWLVSVKGRLEEKQLKTKHIKTLMNLLFCTLALNSNTNLSLTLSQISTVLST